MKTRHFRSYGTSNCRQVDTVQNASAAAGGPEPQMAVRPTEGRRAWARPTRGLKRARSEERGASLVEFALALPLLLALLFGLIEMSWAFAQTNDVRHGAREGARVAAVDIGTVAAVGQAVCDRMDVVAPAQNVQVTLTRVATSPTVSGEGSVGALGQISVVADLKTITGFYNFLLGGKTLASTVEFRLERPAGGDGNGTWWDDIDIYGDTYTCP